MSLFDLTPAEARVARGFAAGRTVDDLATDHGVSANKVRVEVRCGISVVRCEDRS